MPIAPVVPVLAVAKPPKFNDNQYTHIPLVVPVLLVLAEKLFKQNSFKFAGRYHSVP